MKKTITNAQDEGAAFELPLENELLMLKLQAEFGAECTTGSTPIPPVIVNEFLKSVYEFEQKFRRPRPVVKIFEKLRRPFFRKASELADKQLSRELRKIIKYMRSQRMELDVLGDYPDRVIYCFITEEFFEHEMEDLDMEGYVHHFCYEDFHPNHEMDIRNRVLEFLTQWLDKKINEYSWELADPFVHPDTREIPKSDVLRKIGQIFDSYTAFHNGVYHIAEINFEWDERRSNGKAFVVGSVSFDAGMENGECVHFAAPFQFYLANADGWWSIFYFVFPGFDWNR